MRNNSHNKKIKQEENNMICEGINKGKHNFKIRRQNIELAMKMNVA